MASASREGFTVRVLRSGSAAPAGIGFVVGERHIVTCAHVVNTALGRPQREQGRPGPDTRIHVEFPMLGDAEGAPWRNCRVEAWQPPPEYGLAGGDVAGLVLVGEGLPEGAGPARLVEPANVRDVPVAIFGYPGEPPRRTNGAWSAQRLRGAVGGGIIQLDQDSESAIRAQPGYSGSPAVATSEAGDTVIGMLAVAGPGEDARDAYAVSIPHLVAAWPDVLAERTVPECPYRGLRSFTAEDADEGLFVGREDEVARLRALVERQPLVLVTGPSGVGKSSLVSAGLIPAVTREGWAAATYRPGGSPFEALAKALLEIERPGQALTVDDLGRRVSQLRAEGLTRLGPALATLKGEVLLCADQLEEIFDPVTCPHEIRASFLDLLLRGRESGRLHMICTLRSDFFTQLLEHPGAGALIQHQLFGLSPMTRERLERIIVEPAQARGVLYEGGLAQLIAREAGGGAGLPMLEFALTELWPRQQRRQISLAEYQGLGGVTGALIHRAEHVFGELAKRCAEDRIRRVMLAMVRSRQGASEATRRVATREQLGSDWTVAEKLAKRRLAVLDHDAARKQDTAELAHEALIREWPRLRAWVDADADFQRWLTEMEERFSDDDLLSEARIGEADRWLTERLGDIPKEVVSLVERSKSDWLRRIRELEEARARAEEAARQAEARRLAAAAELALAAREVSPVVPVALSIESLRTVPLLEADVAARHALRMTANQIALLDNNGSHVTQVIFSPDGARVAALNLHSVKVFDAITGARLCDLDSSSRLSVVAFNPAGSQVAFGGAQGLVRVFDVATGTEVCSLHHDAAIHAVAFSPDGGKVATASGDGARVFDAFGGVELFRLEPGHVVWDVVFSPDGSRLGTGRDDGGTRVFDAATGIERCRMNNETSEAVYVMAFSPDGDQVATGGKDGIARVFDTDTGTEMCRLDLGDTVYSVTFNRYGTRVATGSGGYRDEASVVVFDPAAGAIKRRLDHGSDRYAVAFGPDGCRVAIGSGPINYTGSTGVFDVATGATICRLDHDGIVDAVAFSSDGTRVAVGSDDGIVRIFDASPFAELCRVRHWGAVQEVAFSPDGCRVATSGDPNTVRVFNAASGAEVCHLSNEFARYAVAFSPDESQIAAGGRDGTARIFNADTGGEVCRLERGGALRVVAFSPDGSWVATGCDDGSAGIFDAATGAELCRMHHEGGVRVVTFSPDRSRLATGGSRSTRVFDAATGTELFSTEHTGAVTSAVFSPDGAWMAVGSGTRMGKGDAGVFDTVTGIARWRLANYCAVHAVTISADGSQVAIGGSDGTARVLDADTGAELSRLDHERAVSAVTFSPDGALVATASADETARVFNAKTGAELCRLEHNGAVHAAAFSPDGTRLASSSAEGITRVWAVQPELLIGQAEGRLTRNLTQAEWRRYFGNEPYRKTRADLP